MLKLPVIADSWQRWIRDAAGIVNRLGGRVDALEALPATNVRYEAGVLEYWDGTAWQPVP